MIFPILQCDTVVAGEGGINTNPSNCVIRQEIYWARDFVVRNMYNGQMSCLIIKMTGSKGRCIGYMALTAEWQKCSSLAPTPDVRS